MAADLQSSWVAVELPGMGPLDLPLAFTPKAGDEWTPRLRESAAEKPMRILVIDRSLPAKPY